MKIVVHRQTWVVRDERHAYHFDLSKEYREWSLRLPRHDKRLYRGTWDSWIDEKVQGKKRLVFSLETTKVIREALDLRVQRPEFFVATSLETGVLVMDTRRLFSAKLIDQQATPQSHIR